MEIGEISQIGKEAIYVIIAISAPILLISLIVGLVISFLQALTQIQENTLTFVPKIISIYLSMLVLMPYAINRLKVFTDHIVQKIIGS